MDMVHTHKFFHMFNGTRGKERARLCLEPVPPRKDPEVRDGAPVCSGTAWVLFMGIGPTRKSATVHARRPPCSDAPALRLEPVPGPSAWV